MMKELFVGYSHKDKELLRLIEPHFKPLEDVVAVKLWNDQRITIGKEWELAIGNAIKTASGFIVLLSPDFLASEFIKNTELPNIKKMYEEKETPIFPILLRPCLWRKATFISDLQIRPEEGTPLSSGNQHFFDSSLVGIVEEIYEHFKDEIDQPPPTEPPNLSEYITRKTAIREIIERFYGDSVDDLALAFADPKSPTFSDFRGDDGDFKYAEIAAGLDIVPRSLWFNPSEPIKYSELLRWILLTADIILDSTIIANEAILHDENRLYIVAGIYHGIVQEGINFSGFVTVRDFYTILNRTVEIANKR